MGNAVNLYKVCLILVAASISLLPAVSGGATRDSKKSVVVKKQLVVKKQAASKARVVAKITPRKKAVVRVAAAPSKPSYGQLAGLHGSNDLLNLKSSVALVMDQDTNEVLFSKNDHAVLPIASLTKLMTGLLVSEARLPMDERIAITQDDVDTEKGSSSRLAVGTVLSRGELLHLALMASENRAAHALGRTYPGGIASFVSSMNARAKLLGMHDTRYVEPTGLSSKNQSSARDLATLVDFAYGDPTLRELSTSTGHQVEVGRRTLQYNNTNRLVKNPAWNIGLQKTGYISEAGQCLVMQARVAGRKLIMVFLDSAGKLSRIGDAERVRRWVESSPSRSAKGSPLASRTQEQQVVSN
jgi:serine-type D-Ala-D-Ala endopeptidase (penicillin-binding protein 7)